MIRTILDAAFVIALTIAVMIITGPIGIGLAILLDQPLVALVTIPMAYAIMDRTIRWRAGR